MNILKEIKYFIQKGKSGFSDRDLWSFDNYLCEIIPPALRRLKERQTGCPSYLWDKKQVNNECHKWEEILEEIAQGFNAGKALNNMEFFYWKKNKDGYMEQKMDMKKNKELTKKFERGIGLFVEHFFNLWD